MDCITVGDHHCEDADQAESPPLVTCRSLNKLDDSTLLKRKSKLRGKSARRGEGMKQGGHQAGCRASMDHHDRSACPLLRLLLFRETQEGKPG